MTYIAIKHGHRNSEFSHQKIVMFNSYVKSPECNTGRRSWAKRKCGVQEKSLFWKKNEDVDFFLEENVDEVWVIFCDFRQYLCDRSQTKNAES